MIRDAAREELPAIQELLVRANDTPYDIDRVAAEKCFGDGFEGAPRARIFGNYEGLSVTCGKYLRVLAVDRAKRGRGAGTALLRDAESRGALVAAAEPGNYFTPGVSESVAGFFRARGWAETARTQNLVTSPERSEGPPSLQPGGSVAVFAAQDQQQRERVLAFIEREFGAIWRFEASHAKTIFCVEANGEIAGFATHEANNRGLGWFGPTGVAQPHRGRGLGRVLLVASLADLHRLGYDRVTIPWTDAVEFYQRSCGARIDQRFVILRRRSA